MRHIPRYRYETAKSCAVCDGTFGLIRYYSPRTACVQRCALFASWPARTPTSNGYTDFGSPEHMCDIKPHEDHSSFRRSEAG
jgi:hypothetical protein